MDQELRVVFVLYELEGRTGPEVAEHLAIRTGTVASRLRRARDELRTAIARVRQSERNSRRSGR
ncbi:MAG: hypothetical protein J0I07_01305 [Myxococcales bacterium]|nr:hypothetical protein [Myxococcales bacterium]